MMWMRVWLGPPTLSPDSLIHHVKKIKLCPSWLGGSVVSTAIAELNVVVHRYHSGPNEHKVYKDILIYTQALKQESIE